MRGRAGPPTRDSGPSLFIELPRGGRLGKPERGATGRPRSMRPLKGVIHLELIPITLGLGLLLTLGGLVGLGFGIYALGWGGRGQRGGLGPIPERGIHAIAGVRMLVGGAISLLLGITALSSYFSA